MIKLKAEILSKLGEDLTHAIQKSIRQKSKWICPGLNRRCVFLTKYLEATQNRRNRTFRKQRFFVGLELIKNATPKDLVRTRKTQSGISYEFKGITPSGEEVRIHIREEVEGKNKRLYLVSTF